MIIIYRAANIADAHLMRQLLENEGIPAFIQGEYLQGAVGELPANTEILVHVADENAEAARVIVDEWESAEPVVMEDDLPESPSDKSSGTVADGFSFGKAVLLFLAIVIGGGLVMAWLRHYVEG
jgi:Putative prokaryotic signal transducing protein